MSAGQESPEQLVRLERGHPDAAELAAVLAVLRALTAAHPALPVTVPPVAPGRAAWPRQDGRLPAGTWRRTPRRP
ncbi:acyl-CoA carboxylase epsilon subunit [Streptomyces sp. NPDC050738]|uniref:acyl-CoA carboxylase epsilon subunit n=1 Tax=Streptomyces sp. NPDC050738 TaxID=3154744 RepID=UPI0034130D2D